MPKSFYLFILTTLILGCNTQKRIDTVLEDKSELYPISTNQKWGFANAEGIVVIPCKFDTVHFFSHGLAVVSEDCKFGYIDSNGDWFIKAQYDNAGDFRYHCATVSIDNKEKNITLKNKRCKETHYYQAGCEGPTVATKIDEYTIKRDQKYALVFEKYIQTTPEAKVLTLSDTTDYIFDSIEEFSWRHLLLRKGNKIGIWNVDGHNKVTRINEDAEHVLLDKGYAVDTLLLQYDELKIKYGEFAGIGHYNGAKYEVSQTPFRIGDHWGIITNYGKMIIPAVYKNIKLHHGLAEVELENGLIGYLNYWKNIEYFKRDHNQ